MLTNPTMNKLLALSLLGMAAAFKEQLERADYSALAFEDRLGLLVDREATEREDRRLERNLKAAKLRIGACIEDLDLRSPRGLDRSVILALADAQWVAAHFGESDHLFRAIPITQSGVFVTLLVGAVGTTATRVSVDPSSSPPHRMM